MPELYREDKKIIRWDRSSWQRWDELHRRRIKGDLFVFVCLFEEAGNNTDTDGGHAEKGQHV